MKIDSVRYLQNLESSEKTSYLPFFKILISDFLYIFIRCIVQRREMTLMKENKLYVGCNWQTYAINVEVIVVENALFSNSAVFCGTLH